MRTVVAVQSKKDFGKCFVYSLHRGERTRFGEKTDIRASVGSGVDDQSKRKTRREGRPTFQS